MQSAAAYKAALMEERINSQAFSYNISTIASVGCLNIVLFGLLAYYLLPTGRNELRGIFIFVAAFVAGAPYTCRVATFQFGLTKKRRPLLTSIGGHMLFLGLLLAVSFALLPRLAFGQMVLAGLAGGFILVRVLKIRPLGPNEEPHRAQQSRENKVLFRSLQCDVKALAWTAVGLLLPLHLVGSFFFQIGSDSYFNFLVMCGFYSVIPVLVLLARAYKGKWPAGVLILISLWLTIPLILMGPQATLLAGFLAGIACGLALIRFGKIRCKPDPNSAALPLG